MRGGWLGRLQETAVRPRGAPPRRDPDRLWLTLAWLHAALAIAALWCGLTSHVALMPTEVELVNAARWYRAGVGPHTGEGLPWLFVPYGRWTVAFYALLPRFGNPYLAGRLLSLAATVALLWLVARLTRAWGGDRQTVRLVVLVALTARPLLEYGSAMRVDLPLMLLGLVGWHLAVTGDARRRWAGIVGLAWALQGKLTALTMPLAAVCYLAPRDRRAAAEVVGGVIGLTVLGVAWQQQLSGGAYLATIGHHDLRAIHGLELLSRLYSVSFPWQLALLGLIVCVPLDVHRRGAAVRWMLFAGYLVAYVTGCNLGASWNYLLDLFLACWLITAVLYAARPEQPCALHGWLRWWLVLHFAFAIGQTWCRIGYLREQDVVRRPELSHCGALLQRLADEGARIAVLGPSEAVEAWVRGGQRNWIAPGAAEVEAATRAAESALAAGRLDAVVEVDPFGRIVLHERKF